jgi:hypothetical protein
VSTREGDYSKNFIRGWSWGHRQAGRLRLALSAEGQMMVAVIILALLTALVLFDSGQGKDGAR